MIIFIEVIICLTALYIYSSLRSGAALRLHALAGRGTESSAPGDSELRSMGDALGRAGFITPVERSRAKLLRNSGILLAAILGAYLTRHPVGGLCGAYAGIVFWMLVLRWRERDAERETLFQIPIALESLILLVESGLGILPAIERFVATRTTRDPVTRQLRLVYDLSARGIPFQDALRLVADASDNRVLRHVFLHLDISNSEGGELIPALRNLSAHAHTEWKLSVEGRIKRLENLVVFPVFLSVIGLILLIAAVPLVPVLNLRETLRESTLSLEQTAPANNMENIR